MSRFDFHLRVKCSIHFRTEALSVPEVSDPLDANRDDLSLSVNTPRLSEGNHLLPLRLAARRAVLRALVTVILLGFPSALHGLSSAADHLVLLCADQLFDLVESGI